MNNRFLWLSRSRRDPRIYFQVFLFIFILKLAAPSSSPLSRSLFLSLRLAEVPFSRGILRIVK